MATIRENFAANLKRLIRESGYNQRTFAEKLGVPEANVSRWVNRVNFPEDDVIDRIAALLKTSYEELVRDPGAAAADPVTRFLRELIRARGYDVVKKS